MHKGLASSGTWVRGPERSWYLGEALLQSNSSNPLLQHQQGHPMAMPALPAVPRNSMRGAAPIHSTYISAMCWVLFSEPP